jgi:hypothetical protein
MTATTQGEQPKPGIPQSQLAMNAAEMRHNANLSAYFAACIEGDMVQADRERIKCHDSLDRLLDAQAKNFDRVLRGD